MGIPWGCDYRKYEELEEQALSDKPISASGLGARRDCAWLEIQPYTVEFASSACGSGRRIVRAMRGIDLLSKSQAPLQATCKVH